MPGSSRAFQRSAACGVGSSSTAQRIFSKNSLLRLVDLWFHSLFYLFASSTFPALPISSRTAE